MGTGCDSELLSYNSDNILIVYVYVNQLFNQTVCLAGTYRSPDEPQNECNPCPMNTVRDVAGAIICECLPGYFRDFGGPEVDCTCKLYIWL